MKNIKISALSLFLLVTVVLITFFTLGITKEVKANSQPEGFPMVIELEDFDFKMAKLLNIKMLVAGKR
ncbi:MAG TPA: hypothetical protein PLC07_06785 [Bacillota bacterium]|nr:hypothetical protein [Bacillota bacterium]